MRSKRQREFQKRMKEAQELNKNHADIYSYRDDRFLSEKPKKRYVQPMVKVGSVIGGLILIWNLYAFSTYLFPKEAAGEPLSTGQLQIHQYIQESAEKETELQELVAVLMNEYNNQTITDTKAEKARLAILQIKQQLETEDERLLSLHLYNEKQINLAYQMANALKADSTGSIHKELETILTNLSENSIYRQASQIDVLQQANIPYEFGPDGTLTYEYQY